MISMSTKTRLKNYFCKNTYYVTVLYSVILLCEPLLQVDGGMTSNSLLMQMQTDLVGINVIRAEFTESTALGAALVAYWGVESNKQGVPIPMNHGTTYTPKISDDERDLRYKQWKMAVERSLGWEQN